MIYPESGIIDSSFKSEAAMTETRRFTRKRRGKVFLGLCSGLGDYFRIDPLIIRLAFLLGFFTLTSGLALLVFYLIAAMVTPYGDSAPA
jgi:phage shock protein PspC (stress-responsive transcriptional regulator)